MSSPVPGTVVYHWFHGVFRHKGVVSDRSWDGKPMVFANSWTSNGVAEIPWEEFAGPRKIFVGGYPSGLSSREVVPRALHDWAALRRGVVELRTFRMQMPRLPSPQPPARGGCSRSRCCRFCRRCAGIDARTVHIPQSRRSLRGEGRFPGLDTMSPAPFFL